MNELFLSQSLAGADGPQPEEVREVQQEAVQGVPFEASAALQQQPSPARHKSFAVDLAYKEFIARFDAGEVIDPDEFCDRFPEYRSSLRRRLSVHTNFAVRIADRIPEGDVNTLWPNAGGQLGEYAVLRELGRGTFGRVYLATEASTGDRPVALKLSLDDNTEARTLGRLAHDHIVPVLYARQHESGFSMVCMPYLGSATLHDLLDRAYQNPQAPPRHARIILDTVRAAPKPGDPDLELGDPPAYFTKGTWVDGVARIGERLAVALAFVHGRGIRHRDIKPSNILLDAAARPRLLDFNLSVDERFDGVSVGGTLPYMAPEQLRLFLKPDCGASKPDGRADLFALAVILYELLTGQHPFGRIPLNRPLEETAQLLLKRQEAGCKPVRSLNPQVDRRLATQIESCLAFDVQDRPTSAAAFAAALQRRFAPRRRTWMLLCSLGALLLASGGVLAYSPLESHLSAPAPRSATAEYEAGCQAFEAGNYDEADACFERALKASPKDERYLFASGRTRLALNDASGAQNRFTNILRPKDPKEPKDPRVLAALAYSELLNKQLGQSFKTAGEAVAAGFPLTPAFCTNRAHAWRHMKPDDRMVLRDKDFEAVRNEFNSVLETHPDYLPALYNRAMFEYDLWLFTRQDPRKENIAIPPQAAVDMDRVLQDVSPNGEYAQLHLDAARIYAGQKHVDKAKVLRNLQLAVINDKGTGMRKTRIDKDPWLTQALGRYTFQEFYKGLPDHPDTSTPLPQELVETPNPIEGWLE